MKKAFRTGLLSVSAAAVAAGFLLAGGVSLAQSPADIVKERQDLMKQNGEDMKTIVGFVQAGAGTLDDVAAAVEEHFLGDALTTVGQRGALEKIAWSLHRFFRRARALGLTTDNSCPLPFRQQDLADALGLSLVHTNKTLAKLRESGTASWSHGVLKIMDEDALTKLSQIDPDSVQTRPLI